MRLLARILAVSALLCLGLAWTCIAFAQDRGIAASSSAPSNSERRVALIIGNAAYPSAPLGNPVSDAQAVAASLRALGFEVTEKQNLNRLAMRLAIDDFGDQLKRGGIGLFYYSGHGAQFSGENYLIPVDADFSSERAAQYTSVPAQQVLDNMAAANNRLNILILDSSRNNPFPHSTRAANQGLANMQAAKGTLIAYATSPGQVANDGNGNHSPYTAALLTHVNDGGIPFEEVFKRVAAGVSENTGGSQTPWYTSSVVGDFYFAAKPQPIVVAMAPPVPAAGPAHTLDEEEETW